MNKYFLLFSVIMNGSLLMYLFGILPFVLFLSSIAIICLIIYTKKLLNDIEEIDNNYYNILTEIESFSDHLDEIHSLEMFYGDQTLQELINHSRKIINLIIELQDQYPYKEEVYDTEEDPQEEEEEPVFYKSS
jgi:hypothetical protein